MTGKREDAIKVIRGVGGKAFPRDYSWICPVCKNVNRAFEAECGYCIHEAERERWDLTGSNISNSNLLNSTGIISEEAEGKYRTAIIIILP